jgi:uncharacterized membrane protein YfcA
MVPLIRILNNFNNKDAIYISNATIAISGLLRYIFNAKKPHPTRKDTFGKPAGTIVDYNLTLILVPAVVVGAQIGVIVNIIIPEPVQIGVNLACLFLIISSTVPRFIRVIKAEKIRIIKEKD